MSREPFRRSAARSELERRVGALPGVEVRTSRYGHGPAFFAGDREIAHFHADGRMDIRLTRTRIRELRKEGAMDPRIRTRGPFSDWAAVYVASARDVALALALVEEAVRSNA